MINEAVRSYLEKRSADVEAELEQILVRVRASRRKDPKLEAAIDAFVEAEASLGAEDPAEGRRKPTTGSAQTMLHELLRS